MRYSLGPTLFSGLVV